MTKLRRAISGIIATLILLAVTVVGGILVWVMVTDTGVMEISQNVESAERGSAVKIIGFDTRNGLDLLGITSLDNDGGAAGVLTAGTDFIVVKVRNTTSRDIFVNSLQINEVRHVFDGAGGDLGPGNLPSEGNFSIIFSFNETQFSEPRIRDGHDVRLIIALSDTIADDIALTEGIRIDIGATEFEIDRFIIPAGTAR